MTQPTSEQFGPFLFDFGAMKLFRIDQGPRREIVLKPTTLKWASVLVRNIDQVTSHEDLGTTVWGPSAPNIVRKSQQQKVYFAQALGADVLGLIETVPNSGYLLRRQKRQSLGEVPSDVSAWNGPSLHAIVAAAAGRLSLAMMKARDKVGWTHHIDDRDVTSVGTAYGLRIIRLASTIIPVALPTYLAARDSLLRMRDRGNLWSLHHGGAQIEATCWALQALVEWCSPSELSASVTALEKAARTDELVATRVTSLSLVISTLAAVRPDSKDLASLTGQLLGKQTVGQAYSWGRNITSARTDSTPAHTARAALALMRVHELTNGKRGCDAASLVDVKQWLLARAENLENAPEQMVRGKGRSRFPFTVQHYTDAWVLKALLTLGADPCDDRIRALVRKLLSARKNGIWDCGEEPKPIWATYAALYALRAWWHRLPAPFTSDPS